MKSLPAPMHDAGPTIIASRMLVLQSKRLMLRTLERHRRPIGNESFADRANRIQAEIESAQYKYRSAILTWGSTESDDYWLVAYSRMVQMGNLIVGRMRGAALILPLPERYQVSADVEMMEHIVGGWTEAMRRAMAAASVA